MLEQDIIWKEQVNKLLEVEQQFNLNDNKKFKIDVIQKSKLYAKNIIDKLLRLYYLIFIKTT